MIRIHQKKKQNDGEGGEQLLRSERLICEEPDPSTGTSDEKKRPEALSAAYRILQSGANSRKMLREKLLKKGFSKDEIAFAIETCENQGFLNERRLFLAHTEFLARKKHFGKRRVRMELLKKFDRTSVDAFFDEAIEEIDFLEIAKAEAEKGNHRGKRYVVSRLSTLGFSSHEIYEAVEGLSFEDEE